MSGAIGRQRSGHVELMRILDVFEQHIRIERIAFVADVRLFGVFSHDRVLPCAMTKGCRRYGDAFYG